MTHSHTQNPLKDFELEYHLEEAVYCPRNYRKPKPTVSFLKPTAHNLSIKLDLKEFEKDGGRGWTLGGE